VAAADRSLERFRRLCLSLPETNETGSFGHPNFRAGKRTFAAFEWIDGRASLAFRLGADEVAVALQHPGFFATPYGRGVWVSVWADAKTNWGLLTDLAERSYRSVALVRMLRELERRQR
jgi:predicted DNA-binding protein (MmcQ/YjbR family)